MKFPTSSEELTILVKSILAGVFRVRLTFFLLGAVFSTVAFLFTGYWDFRDQHQELIKIQYQETVEAKRQFEASLVHFNIVFDGAFPDMSLTGGSYSSVAQNYIREIDAASKLLPEISDEKDAYIAAIADLRKYYTTSNLPEKLSPEWMIFFGEFRQDYDQYLTASEAYFRELASEVGNYTRYALPT